MIIVGDVHLKTYSDSKEVDIFKSIEFILEYALFKSERNLIILGDINDTKSMLSVKPFIEFYNILKLNNNINFFIISGNHDIVGIDESKNEYMTAIELFKDISNVKIITKPCLLNIEGYKCLFLPFDKEENIREFLSCDADVCFGHLGISEAVLSSGISIISSFNASDFSKYKLVFLGHYHKPQELYTESSSIIYVGSIIPLRRDEIYDEKRFIILKSNFEYEFVPITSYKRYYELIVDKDYNEDDLIEKIKKLSTDYKVIVKFLVPYSKELLSKLNELNISVIDLVEKQIVSRGIFSNMSIEEQMRKYLDYMSVSDELKEIYIQEGIKVIREESKNE